MRYVGISSKLVPKVYCLLFEYQFAKYPPHPLAWLWACPLALAVLHTFQFWGGKRVNHQTIVVPQI